ncbi:MAG: Fpg/Nei family DNA glycosylase [Promethearchaeota archaeon]
MPELPDIILLTRSLNDGLAGRTIHSTKVNQPKVLNRSPTSFKRKVEGRQFIGFCYSGKWIAGNLDNHWTIALNLGMGGEVRLHWPVEVPDPTRERVIFVFNDAAQLWLHFWWFGHVHLIPPGKLEEHPQLSTMGVNPLSSEFTTDRLLELLANKRGRIKSYLLDQRFIAGIGNVYVQDILWHAKLHPMRNANTLSETDIHKLHKAIQHVLHEGIRFGPGPGEQDLWGNRGQWGKLPGWPKIAYKTGKPCPTCNALIEELRVGSTTSYLCPKCQI